MESNFGFHQTQDNGQQKLNDPSNNLFISNILNTLPNFESYQTKSLNGENNMNGNSLFSNHLLDPFTQRSNGVLNAFSNFSIDSSNPIDIFCNNGNSSKTNRISPSTSPHTNSSSGSSQSIFCGHCDNNAVNRCLDCNDTFCIECINEHSTNAFTKLHTIVGLGKVTPIGSITLASSMMHHVAQVPKIPTINEKTPQCDIHGESLRFLCETCKLCVCQECTLKDHKDHDQTPIANITVDKAKEKLRAIHDSSKLGIKFIKTSIDRAVNYSQSIERDSAEMSSRVKKAFRMLIMAAEERERTILEQLEKYRQQKVATLADQMTGLRSALAGIAETSEDLSKSIDKLDHAPKIDIAILLANSENQIEKYAAMYKNLQPKEDVLNFIPPNFELLQEIRNQGEIVVNSKNASTFTNNTNGNGHTNGNNNANNITQLTTASSLLNRQEPRSSNSPHNGDQLVWTNPNETTTSTTNASSLVTSAKTYASIVKPTSIAATAFGQAIPGINKHIAVKPALAPSLTFCFDGSEDGNVSRPWGVCVNKNNEIIIADRRNNRIQVFYPDGTYKFKFGVKGTGNGQFDLPAGIATDSNNRIVVVDKDNHRIQVFSATGVFILKFGSYGKELSQFMYPWAVATNTKNQILVTDSRNHRIQLFSPDGHFISRFSFDGVNHSRYLKGLTTPRGVCFNPQGNIIISDFENHRLILIDSTMTKILATKGHEGSALHEFCRPSGICCDDDGRIVVADSKNQRVLIFSPMLEFLWTIEIRPSSHNVLTANMDEKDRPSDVSLLNDGRLVVLVETSPDSREVISPHKTFVQIY